MVNTHLIMQTNGINAHPFRVLSMCVRGTIRRCHGGACDYDLPVSRVIMSPRLAKLIAIRSRGDNNLVGHGACCHDCSSIAAAFS